MKKLIGFILFICLAIVPFASAEETTTSTANAQSSFNYIINDNSEFKSLESPIVSNLAPYTNVPSLYRSQTDIKTSLDQDNNTKFLDKLMFKNKIKMKIMEAYAYRYFFNRAVSTGEIAIDRSDENLCFLEEVPVGDDVWPTATIRIEKEEGIESFDRVICTALKQAYDKSDKSKYFTIKYEISDYSQVGNKGIGGGATITKDTGGATALSGGMSLGMSKAKGNVFKGGYYEITFWNRGKSALVSLAPVVPEIKKKNSENLGLSEIKSKEVFFAFAKYAINTREQQEAINQNISLLAEKITTLPQGKKIYIIGGTSKEGTDNYNIILGKNRAQTVARAYAKGLLEMGISEALILDKLRFV
ncbi:MAG: hypothetical protein Q7T50_05065, partial [Candidatus Magasanikbacteria bacterium]|nr:hypothetical protein [Candidatus Magasanikbacteria bacterium]